MKHLIIISTLAVCGAAALLSGCETTASGIPAKQLKANMQQIHIGMNKDQVIALIGKPARTNSSTDASGVTEEYFYPEAMFWTAGQAFAVGLSEGAGNPRNEGMLMLAFQNDRLKSINTHQ